MGHHAETCRADFRILRRAQDHDPRWRLALGRTAVARINRRGDDVTSDDRKHLRLLPAVERVLNSPQLAAICAQFGRSTVTDWVRQVLSEMRNGRSDEVT